MEQWVVVGHDDAVVMECGHCRFDRRRMEVKDNFMKEEGTTTNASVVAVQKNTDDDDVVAVSSSQWSVRKMLLLLLVRVRIPDPNNSTMIRPNHLQCKANNDCCLRRTFIIYDGLDLKRERERESKIRQMEVGSKQTKGICCLFDVVVMFFLSG